MNRKTNPWYNFALGAAIGLCVLFIFAWVNWKHSQRTLAELRAAIREADLEVRQADLATREVTP